MSYYKRNVGLNRDALFGGVASGSSGKKRMDENGSKKQKERFVSNRTATATATATTTTATRRIDTSRLSSGVRSSSNKRYNVLTGNAKLEALKEAEDCRLKAKKCMTRGVFSGIDPVSAGMWYHKAAEQYKKCGEDRLERLHRIASGDCNRGSGAWSTAANEYKRAAELATQSQETLKRRKTESHKLYLDAAAAYLELGDLKKRGEALVQAALSLLLQDNTTTTTTNNNKLQSMPKDALQELEEAVEAHVPDPLNPNQTHRQTKVSMFLPEEDGGEDINMELCRQHVVNKSYAFETIYKIVHVLLDYNEYPSALYAAGAATYLLEIDTHSTISLARAYLTETILTLAMGDVVGAEQTFLNKHLQNNYYLQSRECKLAEDLIRAIQNRNAQDLQDARTIANKSAMSNLHISIRNLAHKLQLTGIAKDEPLILPTPTTTTTTTTTTTPEYGDLNGDELQASLDANFDEMDNIMNSMGLGDDEPPKSNVTQPPPLTTTTTTTTTTKSHPPQYNTHVTNDHHDDDDFDIDLR